MIQSVGTGGGQSLGGVRTPGKRGGRAAGRRLRTSSALAPGHPRAHLPRPLGIPVPIHPGPWAPRRPSILAPGHRPHPSAPAPGHTLHPSIPAPGHPHVHLLQPLGSKQGAKKRLQTRAAGPKPRGCLPASHQAPRAAVPLHTPAHIVRARAHIHPHNRHARVHTCTHTHPPMPTLTRTHATRVPLARAKRDPRGRSERLLQMTSPQGS